MNFAGLFQAYIRSRCNGICIFELSRLSGTRTYNFFPTKTHFSKNPYFSIFIFDMINFCFFVNFWLKITALNVATNSRREVGNQKKLKQIFQVFTKCPSNIEIDFNTTSIRQKGP